MSDPQLDKTAPLSSHWQPWQMTKLAPANPPQPETASQPKGQKKNPPDERQQGYQAGLTAGRQAGHKEGFDSGKKAGFEAGRKEGLERGLREGRLAAQKELAQQLQQSLQPLTQLVANFAVAMQQLDTDIAAELVDVSLAIGRQLARDQLDERPVLILEVVKELLHTEPSLNGKPRLCLHPEDRELVEQLMGSELEVAGWSLQSDDLITRGGCRLISAHEECDASWETRCKMILAQVRQRRSLARVVGGNG
ncbi:flagellar assembly protein FliH [Porticoccus sp.]